MQHMCLTQAARVLNNNLMKASSVCGICVTCVWQACSACMRKTCVAHVHTIRAACKQTAHTAHSYSTHNTAFKLFSSCTYPTHVAKFNRAAYKQHTCTVDVRCVHYGSTCAQRTCATCMPHSLHFCKGKVTERQLNGSL